MSGLRFSARLVCGLFLVSLPCALGCGESGPVTYPLEGRVVIGSGAQEGLEGQFIEAAQVDAPTKRATGIIGADGSFKLETLDKGQTWAGARGGNYQARLILNDEGDGQVKKPKVPRKYLNFKSSGWVLTVPSGDPVQLVVAPK